MKKQIIHLYLVLIIFLTGCASSNVSVIENYSYDETSQQTNYAVLPYGSVSIPGKWNKGAYNAVGRQQFFKNSDSVEIAIALLRYDKYEFNTSGAQKEMAFVEGFYEWESKYFINSYGLDREVIEKDEVNKYMIYRIYGEAGREMIDSYFLIGERNGNTLSACVSITDEWDEVQKIKFLKGLFMQGAQAGE